MNDLSFIDELTARLDEAAETADVTLPSELDAGRVGEQTNDVAPVRRLVGPTRSVERPSDTRRWASIAAAALILVGGGFAILLTRPGSGPASTSTVASTTPPSTVASPTVPFSSVVGSSTPSTLAPTSMPTVETETTLSEATVGTVEAAALSRTIVRGDQGEDVRALQRRLSDLGFNTGSVDGAYGQQTISAVWAFKTLVDDQPLGQVTDDVTPELWAKIQGDVTVQPRRPGGGTHIEIYLPRQVLVVFRDDVPALIAHISSGELDANGQPVEFCEPLLQTIGDDGRPLGPPVSGESCGASKTPPGVFEVTVEQAGRFQGVLTNMWDPVFFNEMIAIHGALSVPLVPASHGGVQVERHISRIVQSLVSPGDKVFVWDGTQEPEDVSQEDSRPIFSPNGG